MTKLTVVSQSYLMSQTIVVCVVGNIVKLSSFCASSERKLIVNSNECYGVSYLVWLLTVRVHICM